MSQPEAGVQTCRVCLEIGEGHVGEPLISPCAGCRGTSAYIHFSCMAAFYRSRARWWDLSCPTCKHVYEGRAAVELGHLGLAEIEKTYGPDHHEVAVMLTNLGTAYGFLGDTARQRDLLERALVIGEQAHGPNHKEVAITLVNLSNAYGDLGDVARKRDLLERALVVEEREYGPDHREVATTLVNLGNAYGDLGDAARKRDLLERALVVMEREHGPDHREVAVTLMNLGNAYGDLGSASRKRDLLERALVIEEREYGREHREVASTLVNLGNAYGVLGDTRRQKDLLGRALGIFEGNYGQSHPNFAIALTNLAVAHGALGEFGLAEGASQKALRLAREALPSPNAIVGGLLLSSALVQRAAADGAAPPGPLPLADGLARKTWAEASAELREAAGEAAAKAKVRTFAVHATMFWQAVGRQDVAEWLAAVLAEEEEAEDRAARARAACGQPCPDSVQSRLGSRDDDMDAG